jgi:hypothetical protein
LGFDSSLEGDMDEFDDFDIDFDKDYNVVDNFDFEHKDFDCNCDLGNIIVVEDEGHSTVEADDTENTDLGYNCN